MECWAWWPVRTEEGCIAWLCKVRREWDWELNHWGYYEYSGTDGGWRYYKID